MLKFEFVLGKRMMRYPTTAVEQVLGAYAHPESDKFFSCNFNAKKRSLLKKEQVKVDDEQMVVVSTVIYTSQFALWNHNAEAVRLHNSLQHLIGINLDLEEFGYVMYFDAVDKAIRSTFYFFNRFTDKVGSYSNGIKPQVVRDITKKVASRLEREQGLSMDRDALRGNLVNDPQPIYAAPPSDQYAKTFYRFAMQTTDPRVYGALQKALRSLDNERAQELQSVLNEMIDHNGDPSIPVLEMPKQVQRRLDEEAGTPKQTAADLLLTGES